MEIAHRAEILAADEAWWAEREALEGRLGMLAAVDAENAACQALATIEAAILALSPLTMAGLAESAVGVVGRLA